MARYLLILFTILCVLNAIGVWLEPHWLALATKPLLMPSLALWLLSATTGISHKLKTGWVTGLFFSTLGDIILMFEGTLAFIFGLSAFLLAHLSYIGSLNLAFRDQRGFILKQPVWGLLLAVLPLGMAAWIWPGIPGAMLAPVMIYIMVIATLLMVILNLNTYIDKTVFSGLMVGALLFTLSDSLIAQAKFRFPLPYNHFWVMTTYVMAQFLMAQAVVRALRANSTPSQ